jgi:UDP-N-acetylmuramate--alanine ligase
VAQGRVSVVVQPHRYSRLKDLMDDFARCVREADQVFVAPVYSAGESPLPQVDHHHLMKRIRELTPHEPTEVIDAAHASQVLASHLDSGDYVVFLGAGDITRWANDMPALLENLSGTHDQKRA